MKTNDSSHWEQEKSDSFLKNKNKKKQKKTKYLKKWQGGHAQVIIIVL